MLHLMPSGILYPDKLCVIGNRVALDRDISRGEDLEARVSTTQSAYHNRAHILMPYRKSLTNCRTRWSAAGNHAARYWPAYADKMERVGFPQQM